MKKLLFLILSAMMLLGMVSASVNDQCTSYGDRDECEGDPSCDWATTETVCGTGITSCCALAEDSECEDYFNEDDCMLPTTTLLADGSNKEACIWDSETFSCLYDCEGITDEEECNLEDRCEYNADAELCEYRFTGVGRQTEDIAGSILQVVYMVLGEPDRRAAARMGLDMPTSSLEILLFVYILPILFLFMILADMFHLMGMFRPVTSKVLAIIVALFAARAQVYLQITAMIGSVFNNFFVGSLSMLFGMMIVWWLINHFLLGYKHAETIAKTDISAIDYLTDVGKHLNKLGKDKKE